MNAKKLTKDNFVKRVMAIKEIAKKNFPHSPIQVFLNKYLDLKEQDVRNVWNYQKVDWSILKKLEIFFNN